jgi:hypothetical protein
MVVLPTFLLDRKVESRRARVNGTRGCLFSMTKSCGLAVVPVACVSIVEPEVPLTGSIVLMDCLSPPAVRTPIV